MADQQATERRSRMDTVERFTEPRAWALQWDGTALIEVQSSFTGSGRSESVETERWTLGWAKLGRIESSRSTNGNGVGALARPNGFALEETA